MFTDKELDELDARFKSAMEDKFDAYNEELNARQKEIERLRELVDAEQSIAKGIKWRNAYLEQQVKGLRAALAKSCEEGRDGMYDCGYNRLRAALERIAGGCGGYSKAQHIAREALREVE